MIHGPELREVLDEQIRMTEAAATAISDDVSVYFPAYIENLGICPDCLIMLAALYCAQDGIADDAVELIVFMRAFATGVMVGRRYPTVEGI